MPLEGEKLDELLSGLIDGRLDPAERSQVEEALAAEPRNRLRLEELRQLASDVRSVGARLKNAGRLPSGFADRVVAAAQQAAESQRSTPASAPASVSVTSPSLASDLPSGGKSTRRMRWIAASVAALAAAVLAAVFLPKLLDPQPIHDSVAVTEPNVAPVPQPSPATPELEPAPATAYVDNTDDNLQFKISYALVVDIQATQTAVDQDVLGEVLAGAGIYQNRPVAANDSVQKALANARMIVQAEDAETAQDTMLYYIRGNMHDLSLTIEALWKDQVSFPNVSLNLAMDNPQAKLVEAIAQNSGKPAGSGDSFAIPISSTAVAASATPRPSPFPGASANVQYVSSRSRAQGWNAEATPFLAPTTNSNMLIVVRVVK